MRLLLHTCCGPCLLFPLSSLRERNIDITSYFYNPNIHPFREYKLRLETWKSVCESEKVDFIAEKDYHLKDFLQKIVYHEDSRCPLCYEMRLSATARYAAENNFDAFSTTLLYSIYQNHFAIAKIGNELSDRYKIPFHFEDFSVGWQFGIDKSIQKNLYRQSYCGCIYSEQERYDNRLKKKIRRLRKAAHIKNV